jgi:histidine ammonia-lyase
LSFEAQRAGLSSLLPEVLALHPVPGQADIAHAMLDLLRHGDLTRPGGARLLHDPLSFRCTASVLGAALVSLRAATAAVELELNTSDDNPAILAESDRVVPTASFDLTHLTLALETLGLALSRVAALTAARTVKLMSESVTGLPRFLTPRGQGSSGLAPLQKTVAALVAEIQHDTSPMASCVLPVADGIEDYATMAVPVARKTAAITRRLRLLAAAELLTAAQAIDLRSEIRLGEGTARIQAAVRSMVPILDADRALAGDLLALDRWLDGSGFETIRNGLFPAHSMQTGAAPRLDKLS